MLARMKFQFYNPFCLQILQEPVSFTVNYSNIFNTFGQHCQDELPPSQPFQIMGATKIQTILNVKALTSHIVTTLTSLSTILRGLNGCKQNL